jgi:hypothetical protein
MATSLQFCGQLGTISQKNIANRIAMTPQALRLANKAPRVASNGLCGIRGVISSSNAANNLVYVEESFGVAQPGITLRNP